MEHRSRQDSNSVSGDALAAVGSPSTLTTSPGRLWTLRLHRRYIPRENVGGPILKTSRMTTGASVHLTKLAAAERQLNAAIRLFLINEDPLAIHTVGAAAYRILRDLKQRRGRSELSDLYGRGLYYVARDLVDGKLESMPAELAGTNLEGLVNAVCGQIRDGAVTHRDDIKLRFGPGEEVSHWGAFNLPGNFLKHADKDPRGVLDEDALNNENLLLAAAGAYIDVSGGRFTPEMMAFHVYRESEFDFDFESVSAEERRAFFYDYIDDLRRKQQ